MVPDYMIHHGFLLDGFIIAHRARIRFLSEMNTNVSLDVTVDVSCVGTSIADVLLLCWILPRHLITCFAMVDQFLNIIRIEDITMDARDMRVAKTVGI